MATSFARVRLEPWYTSSSRGEKRIPSGLQLNVRETMFFSHPFSSLSPRRRVAHSPRQPFRTCSIASVNCGKRRSPHRMSTGNTYRPGGTDVGTENANVTSPSALAGTRVVAHAAGSIDGCVAALPLGAFRQVRGSTARQAKSRGAPA
jgi:hypothetical protein